MPNYTMMVEYVSGGVAILPSKNGSYIIANRDNLYLLHHIGKKLLESNTIKSYQILTFNGPAVDTVEAAEVHRDFYKRTCKM